MTETLRINLDAPDGICAMCTREPLEHDQRLVLTLRDPLNVDHVVTLCRHCVGEHAPSMLHQLNTALEGGA